MPHSRFGVFLLTHVVLLLISLDFTICMSRRCSRIPLCLSSLCRVIERVWSPSSISTRLAGICFLRRATGAGRGLTMRFCWGMRLSRRNFNLRYKPVSEHLVWYGVWALKLGYGRQWWHRCGLSIYRYFNTLIGASPLILRSATMKR